MAEKVGIKEAEYNQMVQALKTAHESGLEQITQAMAKLESLNTKGGAFYTKDLTPKVTACIGEINSIATSMTNIYTTHETVVESFRTAIENYDSCC